MRYKRYSVLLIISVVLLMIVSGCSKFDNSALTEGEKLGSIRLSINIPDLSQNSLMSINSTQNVEEIIPEKLVITLIKGSVTIKEDIMLDEQVVELAFDQLEEGNWTVKVELKDTAGHNLFDGTNGVIVVANSVAPVSVELTPTPGVLEVRVPVPQGFNATSGQVTLKNPVEGSDLIAELEISNGTGVAHFTGLKPGLWPVTVELMDDQGVSRKGTGEIMVLPGRETMAEVTIPGDGSLEINLTVDSPPHAPEYVTATYGNSQIVLNWQAPGDTDIAGYMVYRSMEKNGRKVLLTDTLVTGTTYTDTDNIFAGNNYWYWVQTYDDNGLSSELSEPCAAFAEESISFADPELEMAVREEINKMSGTLAYEDVRNIEELRADHRGIESLDGIEYLTSLVELELDYNNITDLTPLAKLPKLRYLYIYDNEISDISPLAEITTLEGLFVDWNNISDFTPLAKMDNLRWAAIGYNPVADFEGLINTLQPLGLEYLSLRGLNIDDSKLNLITTTLNNVGELGLQENMITDITPLTEMSNLWGVRVSKNPIQNYSLIAEMSNLESLSLWDSSIVDYSFLANLTGLRYLNLEDCNLTDGDLQYLTGLTQLRSLYLSDTWISDLSFLTNLTGIERLRLGDCNITNIDPLLNLTALDEVYLGDNPLDLSTGSPASQVIQTLEDRGVRVYY